MREIKFRGWDKINNQMLDWRTLTQSIYNNDSTQLLYSVMVSLKINYILLQYTGVKDKNGKEIYEGDIMSANVGYCYYVKSDDAAFYLFHYQGLKNYRNDDLRWGLLSRANEFDIQLEIIGNIYENPELMEGE